MDNFVVILSSSIFYILPFLDLIKQTSAVYCQYRTEFGVEITHCQEQCCSHATHRENACCEFTENNGVYIGASLGTMILVGVIFLCFTYLCCKQRMIQRAREHSNCSSNTRTRSRRRRHRNEPSVPTVSISVEPIMPPPYESLDLPPPYFPIAGPSGDKTEEKSYFNQPPPAYTQTVEDDK